MQAPQEIKGLVQIASPSQLKKLRDSVAPQGKKGNWMRFLSDGQLLEVYYRLRRGQSCQSLATMCQRDWKYQQDSDIKSVARTIRAFRDRVLDDLKKEKIGKAKEDKIAIDKAAAIISTQTKKKIDGMVAMARALEIQMDRLELLHEKELKSMPLKMVEDTIKNIGALAERYVRLQMELGLLDRKPREVDLTMHHKFAGLIKHTVGDDGVKVVNAAQALLEMAEKEALTLARQDDGSYRMNSDEDFEMAALREDEDGNED